MCIVDGRLIIQNKNKKDPNCKHFKPPKTINQSRAILTFSDEKIKHRECHGVSAEHVVPTSTDTLYTHSRTPPNHIGVRHLRGKVAEQGGAFLGGVVTGLALEMRPRDAQGGYQHRDATQKEYCAR